MQDADWHAPTARVFGERLNGKMLSEFDTRGNAIVGRTLTILYNASTENVRFVLPLVGHAEYWCPILDTSSWLSVRKRIRGGDAVPLVARSILVLELRRIWPAFLANLLLPSRQPAEPPAMPKLHDSDIRPRKSA